MKGKLLENIVLGVGLLVIALATFLMFADKDGSAAGSINIIFATGFIIYIAYSYLLSKNLNEEIYQQKKQITNLKDEINRLKQNLAQREATINAQTTEISGLQTDLKTNEEAREKLAEALKKANSAVKKLNQQLAEVKQTDIDKNQA